MYYCVIVAFCQHALNEHAMLCYALPILVNKGFGMRVRKAGVNRIFFEDGAKVTI